MVQSLPEERTFLTKPKMISLCKTKHRPRSHNYMHRSKRCIAGTIQHSPFPGKCSTCCRVDAASRSQPQIPDIVNCVAGTGMPHNFITELSASDLDHLMRSNYFTVAYTAKSIFKAWTGNDRTSKDTRVTSPEALRRIVFVNSAAAFVGLPGHIEYSRTSRS